MNNQAQKDESQRIAQTIAKQMGGTRRLQVMVGANSFTALKSGLQFRFKGSRKANCCRVTYDYGKDLYTFSLLRIGTIKTSFKVTEVCAYDEVYFDMLVNLFESETGLYLSL